MKTLRILSASDRNNYGDLLFPLIISEFLNKCNNREIKLINYGIRDSDLKNFGALPTRSFNELVKNVDAKDTIVIAGGEVLGGYWLNILRFFSPFWNKIYHIRLLRGLIRKTNILDVFQSYFYSSSKPFILDGRKFKNKKIVYNSVGALGIKNLLKKRIYRNYFNNVSNLTVRDNVSLNNFKNINIKCRVVPDSAILMSDLLSPYIKENLSEECYNFSTLNYIFLQFGNNKEPDDLYRFIEELKVFAAKNNLKVLLCPIGLALDHDDEVILKRIKKIEDSFVYYTPQNLYETMFLIKESSIYLGTSLHGFITAQSFSVPFFVFDEKINKNEQYIDTWNVANTKCFGNYHDFEMIQKRMDEFNYEEEKLKTKAQKELVYNNLRKLLLND